MTTHVQHSTRAGKQASLVGVAILTLVGFCFGQAATSLSPLSGPPVAANVLGPATRSVAQQESVLHSFDGTDGAVPQSVLIFDAAGNLYGEASEGGANGEGTVFELTPKAGGSWTEKVLHTFGRGTDGTFPLGGLIFDAAGNLYGTALCVGAYCGGDGMVFELMPKKGGGWTEKVLHRFTGADGQQPAGGVVFDAIGNLYGTTYLGGAFGGGTVFELTPKKGGDWSEKVLHSFGKGADGSLPLAGVTFDAAGNIYSTTYLGGALGGGTVFELTKSAGWKKKILHSFGDSTSLGGSNPNGGVIFDAAGNLYGTTYWGGTLVYGTVFELKPQAAGGWIESVLHNFPNNYGEDGSNPAYGILIFDAAGNLYGTASYGGGNSPGGGTVFELSPAAGGSWTYNVLHTFNDDGVDGLNPGSSLIFDIVGNLYGTTWEGGSLGSGTVFKITP